MKITFLLLWAYGMGGLGRTTVNTANHFAERGHDVTLLSFFRHRDEPMFDIDPRVTLRSLVDVRESRDMGRLEKWERSLPSVLTSKHDVYHDRVTLRGDLMLFRALRSVDADVLITTRPFLNLAAAMWTPRRTIVIGQEHLNFVKHAPALRWQMGRWYPRLDALVTLTEGDRADYQQLLKGRTVVRAIGNAVARGPHPRSQQVERVVVSAGRLTAQKRYTHLIRAFAKVAERHPDWRLRIYGWGRQKALLRSVIDEYGLGDNVFLMGRTMDTEREFARASIMAMSSKFEGFPMVILEAFACGLPVVSYDCPRGPAEMITSGYDGLLVRNGDREGLSDALLQLIEDEELRRKMAHNALETAHRHSIEQVGEQWEDLFAELRANRRRRPTDPYREYLRRRARRLLPSSAGRRVRWTR